MTLHPQCRPKGNQYVSGGKSEMGLFDEIDDNALIMSIISYWHPEDLLSFGQTCKHAYVYSWFEEIWKFYCIRDATWSYNGSWRSTWTGNTEKSKLNCMVYNDLIFNIHRYANSQLPLPETGIPIAENISVDEFLQYESQRIPCILRGACKEWPAFKKWNWEYLSDVCGDTLFQSEQLDITFREFAKYATSNPNDESPIYLFDKNFTNTVPVLADDFDSPKYFIDDLFQYLPNRPDNLWIIAGPERSGSTWHKDPNQTSAWNATITGKKLWIFMPPNKTPPGIFPSADGSSVTTPLSLMDWYCNYRDHCDCTEAVSEPGDVVFIPNGWWHMVINLEPGIALTQNYVNRFNLRAVLKFLKCKREQISGTKDANLFDSFTKALQPIDIPEVQQVLKEFEKKSLLDNAFLSGSNNFSFKFGK
eukprot:NODE_153_length_16933_cov_0.442141.p2 type:complete len:419 gc:universal NODE_153_length_16933_cov_0.442141:13127-14383(+)